MTPTRLLLMHSGAERGREKQTRVPQADAKKWRSYLAQEPRSCSREGSSIPPKEV